MRWTGRSEVLAVAVGGLALMVASCGGGAADDANDASSGSAGEAAGEVADEVAESFDTVADTPSNAGGAGTDATASGVPMRVGIVAPSAENDRAWTQSMVDSLNRVAEGRDIDVDISGGLFVVDDAAAAIRAYAADGVDLVIAHGIQFSGSLQDIADEFPDVSFALGTSTDFFGNANVFAYSVDAGQGGYVNGVMAAQVTTSNVIGVIGPVPAGDAQRYIDGFVAGVAAQNPDVAVNVNYIDSFGDVQLAAEAATALVANGADVLTGTAQMVVGATGVAAAKGIPWFGTQSNQVDLGADVVVASQVYHWEVVIEQMLDKIAAGILGGESFEISFENAGLAIEFNEGYRLDADVRNSADATIAGLTDGTIEVPAAT